MKWRVQLPACNFNKKWTPSGIFQGFCHDFKLFCLNELLYKYFSRISRICIFMNTFRRLLLLQTNLIFLHSPFLNSRSSATFCHVLLFIISLLWKCSWDLSYRTGNWLTFSTTYLSLQYVILLDIWQETFVFKNLFLSKHRTTFSHLQPCFLKTIDFFFFFSYKPLTKGRLRTKFFDLRQLFVRPYESLYGLK